MAAVVESGPAEDPVHLLKQCFLPLGEQLPRDFSSAFRPMKVRQWHEGFRATCEDLSQLRMALNGAVLRRLASTFRNEEVEERLHLTAGLQLAFDHSNSGWKGINSDEELENATKREQNDPIAVDLTSSKRRDLAKIYHISVHPVVSCETKKKADCFPFWKYFIFANKVVFANAKDFGGSREDENRIVDAAVKFQLLLVSTSAVAKVSFTESGPHTRLKDGVFVVYNAVRLAVVLEEYRKGVKEENYLPIRTEGGIDVSLLTAEDKDVLLHSSKLPTVIQQVLDTKRGIKPNLLAEYLVRLSRRVSVFYRNCQILKEPLQHLLPSIQARATVATAVHAQLMNGLDLLDIKIPSRM